MGKIKHFLRNLSIRKTFMLYVVLFLLLATAVSATAINIASNIRTKIMFSYTDYTNSNKVDGSGVIINYVDREIAYSGKDAIIIKLCDIVTSFSVPVFFSVCILAAAFVFYRNKLKRPIEILSGASAKIAENNLDFQVQYESHDEMGKLCASFEKMRSSLDHNNRELWRSMEERKRLNTAFAHDLRTPLTVLRGYTDFLGKYVPDNKLKKDKILSTIATMDTHITRLENYVESMYSLQKLDEIEPVLKETDFIKLSGQLKDSAKILCQDKAVEFTSNGNIQFLAVDSEIVAQVFENLISNAARYSNKYIQISLYCSRKALMLTIMDDGPGFSEDALKKATEPFYRGENDSSQSHFGLGLNICRILCEKHCGKLELRNSKTGGAKITAVFGIPEILPQ